MEELREDKRGFTLVELIVVLVILAVLAAILVPTLVGYIGQARAQKDYSTAAEVAQAAQSVVIEQKAGHPEWTYEQLSPVASSDHLVTNGKAEADEVYELAGVSKGDVKWFYINIDDQGAVTPNVIDGNKTTTQGTSHSKFPTSVCIGDYVYYMQSDGSWASSKVEGTQFTTSDVSTYSYTTKGVSTAGTTTWDTSSIKNLA